MSAVSNVVNAVKDFLVGTAFKHRVTSVAVPAILEAINQTQAQFTDVTPNTPEQVVILTVAFAVLGYLRGKVAPA